MLTMAMAGDVSDLLYLHRPLPDGVQFFASVLTMPDAPPDSTLAFGAERQGLFLTPTQAMFHVIETPPSNGRKVPGKVVEWLVAREDVLRVDPDPEKPCVSLVTASGSHTACLGAIEHHREAVVAAVAAWAPNKE